MVIEKIISHLTFVQKNAMLEWLHPHFNAIILQFHMKCAIEILKKDQNSVNKRC